MSDAKLTLDPYLALFKRFGWMLVYGMWRGYREVDSYDSRGNIKVIGAGIQKDIGVWSPFRIFWERK